MTDNDTKNGGLSARQKRAVSALLSTPSIRAAAEAARCSEASLWRWLRLEAFQQELDAAAAALIEGTVAGQVADFQDNQRTMREIRDDEDNAPGVRLRAAISLDTSLLRWRELRDVERRLARLEEVLLRG